MLRSSFRRNEQSSIYEREIGVAERSEDTPISLREGPQEVTIAERTLKHQEAKYSTDNKAGSAEFGVAMNVVANRADHSCLKRHHAKHYLQIMSISMCRQRFSGWTGRHPAGPQQGLGMVAGCELTESVAGHNGSRGADANCKGKHCKISCFTLRVKQLILRS